MMRSLYSGVAGLRTHQTRMDVIGNNIANVNTVAYKSQAMNFSDLLYQTTQSASGPNDETGRGGVNARQIGLGAKTAAIGTTISQAGSAQTTNNPFDIYITGKSFFIVSDGTDNFFTRDGSFCVDAAGNLVMSSNGYNVMGWQTDTDPKNANNIVKDTVTPLRIMSPENMTYPAEATTAAYMSGIIDKFDDNVKAAGGKIVNMKIYDNMGYSYTAKYSITETATAGSYAMVLTDVLDSDGISITQKKDANGDLVPSGLDLPALNVGGTIDDNYKVTTGTGTDLGQIKGGTGTALYLHYDVKDGSWIGITATETLTRDDTTGRVTDTVYDSFALNFLNDNPADNEINFGDVSVDMSSTTNVNNDGTSTVAATPGTTKGLQRGRKVGEMTGVSISNAGMIYATYDNGQSKLLGQIAAAQFANAEGLEKAGDNLYKSSMNSGDFDGIGVDVTADGGYFTTGELEMSNVDLSNELTTMIVTQRGFQANSRIITVSDSMLEELVNLKR
ncbi:MAG: flagellar hook-basal body complex protein [Lachnospiraceae bacterium]|nr:flagellar hook-basal body complex protein [Lachnospiraceae bacterium]